MNPTKSKTRRPDRLTPAQDRAAGAVMGVLIGDAMAVGPHWYYDLDEMRHAYGGRITDYVPVLPNRYHVGVELGDVSQSGQFNQLLIQSIVACDGYREGDYTRRLDELLDTLDGTESGGRFTEQAVRDIWHARKVQGMAWRSAGFASVAETSEAAQRAVVIAARYANDLMQAGRLSADCAKLTHADPSIVTASTAYGVVVAAVISGIPLDGQIGWTLRELIKDGKLPFTHAVLAEERKENLAPEQPTLNLPFPDVLLGMGWWIEAAKDPGIRIEPPEAVSKVYGMACPLMMAMPAAFSIAARYPDSFEDAMLTAINAGGNNLARGTLTGALSGAQTGLSGIPARFITGLKNHQQWVGLAIEIARNGARDLS
ncbi:MAG: ADP-ribosylglycohydrolase family protein [Desulfosarcinaceae bacterium]|nr:ADP-ribosylglycohydrolase family protein [Desulfosarcinaceae bacterium]